MSAQTDDDRLTCIISDIEVHFEVFFDEGLEEKIEEVTSPKSGENKLVPKRAPVPLTGDRV